jgi:hypothetical protein
VAQRGREGIAKRARERARKAKQDAKRERRHSDSAADVDPNDGPDTDALMEEFRLLSESHAAGNIAQDAYDQERQRIFEELGLETQ